MLLRLVHSRSRSLIFAATAIALGLVLPVPVGAQTKGAVISGVVTDSQGGALRGAALTARETETGASRSALAAADGSYRLAGLVPGVYDVRAELEGFGAVEVKALTLTVGLETRQDVRLNPSSVREAVTVTSQSSIAEPNRTDVSAVITPSQIDALPLGPRQPLGLALLLPGSSQDAVRPRKFNVNLGAGAFANAGSFLIDGVWNKEGVSGEPRQDFPQAAVREFQVSTSNAGAETGWTAGGGVTMITKSGTNRVSGEAFEYFRDKALNAENRFEALATQKGAPKPNYRRNQFGGAVGGPIVTDRLHFFGSVERTTEQKYITVNTGKPAFYSGLEGIFAEPEYSNTYFGKVNGQISARQNAFVRFAGQQQDYTCDTCGGTAAFNTDGGINQPRRSAAGGHTWVLSSRVLNEVHGQYSFYGYYAHPVSDSTTFDFGTYPAERLAQSARTFVFPSLTYGWTTGGPNLYVRQWTKEIRDEISIVAGQHAFKFGGGIRSMPAEDDLPQSVGTWTSDQPFDGTATSAAVLTRPTLFTASLGSIRRDLPNVYEEVYVQDEWRPVSNLTLNLGLRWDYQSKVLNSGLDINDRNIFPTTGTARQIPFVDFSSRGDKNNIAPRVGAAWDVTGHGQAVARGAYGIYYNALFSAVMRGEQTNFRQTAISIANPNYPDPYGGLDPLMFASTSPQNISIVDNGLENPKAVATSGGFSQQVASTMALHADVVYNHLTGVPLLVNINPRANGTTGVRPLTQLGRIDQLQNLGENKYKALLVRLEKRLDRNYQFLVSYTLAKGEGSIPFTGNGTGARVTDSQNPSLDWGPTASDRRHVLVASGAYVLPAGIQVGAVWTVRSTMPFNAVAGVDLNGDGVVSDFVPGTTRAMGNRDNATLLAAVNSYRATLNLTPIAASQVDSNAYNALDLRANKSFALGGRRKLELIAQVFNALGRDNLSASGGASGQSGVPAGWVLNARSDSFGRINQAYNNRQAELAIRMGW